VNPVFSEIGSSFLLTRRIRAASEASPLQALRHDGAGRLCVKWYLIEILSTSTGKTQGSRQNTNE
jgi:hypothetical protein